jgi:hypothetical protein
VGARNHLERWLRLTAPLDYDGVRRTLSRWNRYAGLGYFHMLLDRLEESGNLAKPSLQDWGASAFRQHSDAERSD